MKRIILILLVVFSFIAYALQVNIDSFNASSDSKVITIEWKTNDESFIKSYDLERTSGQLYTKITSLEAKGVPTSYRFIDESALLSANINKDNSPMNNTNYSYRIKIIGKDNSFVYSNPVNVTHSVSSIRKTWGMLKEMFR
jgi:hypothetical protein